MPTPTLNEALAWLLTVGLPIVASALTGAIVQTVERRHAPVRVPVSDGPPPVVRVVAYSLPTATKQLISYVVPFVLVGLAYSAQLALSYTLWNIDNLFGYVLYASTVAFGTQAVYWVWKQGTKPDPLDAAQVATPPAVLDDPA